MFSLICIFTQHILHVGYDKLELEGDSLE